MLTRAGLLAAIAMLGWPAWACGQTINPGPPGPFVFDLRGVSTGLPSAPLVVTPVSGGDVPTRGLGGSIGGHVYGLDLGPARLGAGLDLMVARRTASGLRATLWTVAPQLSFNFGTSDGWSYLSVGVGAARTRVDPGIRAPAVRDVNYGGGARWFLNRHLGIGFDVRIHRMAKGGDAGSEVPAATAAAIGVGLSLK